MTWDELVDAARGPPDCNVGEDVRDAVPKEVDGKVVASLGNDGAITVKLVDEVARADALALPGTALGSHAFAPSRPTREWVHVPAAQASEWHRLVELALF